MGGAKEGVRVADDGCAAAGDGSKDDKGEDNSRNRAPSKPLSTERVRQLMPLGACCLVKYIFFCFAHHSGVVPSPVHMTRNPSAPPLSDRFTSEPTLYTSTATPGRTE